VPHFLQQDLKVHSFCSEVWCASVDTLWQMSHQSGTDIPQSEQHDTSSNCNWWNISKGLWARTQTAVLQIESSTFTMKSQGWTKSVAHKTDDYFGLWHIRYSCPSSSSTGWNCEYGSTSTLWVQCPELIKNSIILHDNATAHLADTVKNVVWLYNNHPVFQTSAKGLWSNSKTEAVITWRVIADRQTECFKGSFSEVGAHYCFTWGRWCWPSSCHWWQTAYNLREYFEGFYNVRWVLCLFKVGMWNDEVQFLLQALRFSE
jgi:hypothetical protein